MPSVYLGCPTTRDFSAQYVRCLWETRIRGRAMWEPVLGQAIDVGRNNSVKRFLRTDFEYMLIHDSDATWHPDAVQRLVERGLPLVTGVIFHRSLPTVPTIGKMVSVSPDGGHMYSFAGTIERMLERADDELKRGNLDQDFRNELLFDKTPNDLQEIDGCGMHFCLVRRDVLEKIGYPWFACVAGPNAGEDFDFCRKVQAAGFPLYVDYSVWTGHVVGDSLEVGLKQYLMFRDKANPEVLWKV